MSAPFLILAAFTVAGAIAAMTLRKLVHCALALAVSLVGLAGLFLNLNAEFVGLVQILVYVGAVVILIVFAILLTRSEDAPRQSLRTVVTGVVVSAAVFVVLAWAIGQGGPLEVWTTAAPHAAIEPIGDALMRRFVFPLELVGLLLTAALIGAVVLAMEEKRRAQ